ncbi:MAG: 7-cyano-7-deazaguanine/7-aminomethyl-7-deazaguanine transporter [Arsenophonus sp. ET-DL9-MAG3]
MFKLTSQQKNKSIICLSFLHIFFIIISNYLIQFPIIIFYFHATWGVFTFPFIFLITDLTVRIYGPSLAKKIIMVVILPGLFFSYIFSTLFYEGKWQGFIVLNKFNLSVARIVIASFTAYAFGQFMDIFIFNKLCSYRYWWVAPIISMFFGKLLDTISFFFIGFYQSNNYFIVINLIEIALVDYSINLFICLLFLLPAYRLLLNSILSYILND